MKWFDQWFYRQTQRVMNNQHLYENQKQPTALGSQLVAAEDPVADWHDGLNIRLKRVNGGYIVNFRRYDRVKDSHRENIYIITDDSELEKELGKLITLESMR